MIKTYYGGSIHADIKKALAEKGLGDKVHVHEPNKSDVATMLQNGTCLMPCVLPYVESKYIISSSFDTYSTTGANGEPRIHSIDFQNSIPNVKANLIHSLKIPAIYAHSEAIKKLCAIMDEKKCNVQSIIEISEKHRKQKEERAAQTQNPQVNFKNFDQIFSQFPGNKQQDSTPISPAKRTELLQHLKKALDLEIAITSHTDSLPFFNSPYEIKTLLRLKPKDFSSLLKAAELIDCCRFGSFNMDLWKQLIREEDLLTSAAGVYQTLRRYGVSERTAFTISQKQGMRALGKMYGDKDFIRELEKCDVPDEYIFFLKDIAMLPAQEYNIEKIHAALYQMIVRCLK